MKLLLNAGSGYRVPQCILLRRADAGPIILQKAVRVGEDDTRILPKRIEVRRGRVEAAAGG